MNKKEGSVALTTVVIIMGVLLAAGIVVLFISSDLAMSVKNYDYSVKIDVATRSCFEETLLKLVRNKDLQGDISFSILGSNCNVNIINDGSNSAIKIVTLTLSENEYSKTVVKKVNTSTDPFTIE